jgi:hypothetical protein
LTTRPQLVTQGSLAEKSYLRGRELAEWWVPVRLNESL